MTTTERRAERRRDTTLSPYLLRLVSPEGHTLGLAVPESISTAGGLLLASAACTAGEVLLLEPECPDGTAGRPLAFRVLRCMRPPMGGCFLAGTFVPPLTEDEVLFLAGPA